ncbi:hypothetical protein BGX26_002103 [Mortierella sp. AD094]|nr:hypothetical protein BGX26_002103 [Mortierella sp. AD094]
MDIAARIQYLKEHRHKEAEQLWRGFSDKFQLSVSARWLDSIATCLDFLEKDPEHTTWEGEMKAMLRSEHCEHWRAHYLQPKRSRLHGIFQRTTAQESAGAIVNTQDMIKQARHVLTNNVQEELASLRTSNAPLITTGKQTRHIPVGPETRHSPLIHYALTSWAPFVTTLPAGWKHPRDAWGGLDGLPPKTPRNRCECILKRQSTGLVDPEASPTIVRTENIDSPNMIQSGDTLPGDDEQSDPAEEDEINGQDFLLPDKVKKKAVYIEDTDEALGRSGIIFLGNNGSALQQEHFGTDSLAQIRQKMLKYWHTADVAASRNKARAWLDLIADKNYDRSEILIEMVKRTNSRDRPFGGQTWNCPMRPLRLLPSQGVGIVWIWELSSFPIGKARLCFDESAALSAKTSSHGPTEVKIPEWPRSLHPKLAIVRSSPCLGASRDCRCVRGSTCGRSCTKTASQTLDSGPQSTPVLSETQGPHLGLQMDRLQEPVPSNLALGTTIANETVVDD